MENNKNRENHPKLSDIQKIMSSPYQLPKHITSNDVYINSWVYTFDDGSIINFDMYKRNSEHSQGFSYIVIKNNTDMQPVISYEDAKAHILDYIEDYYNS